MAAYQGTLATIRRSVIDKLKLDGNLDVARVEEWINLAYQDAVQQTGCLQQTASAPMTSGVSSYDLPVAVAWIKTIVVTYPDGSVSAPLAQVTLEEILERRRDTSATGQIVSRPVYTLVGQNQIEVWPTPSTGQAMEFWYVYLPDALTLDADVPLIMEPYGSKLLEHGALVEGARFKKDPALGDYEAGLAFWLARFQVWLNRREGTSPRVFRVRGPRRMAVLADRSADVLT